MSFIPFVPSPTTRRSRALAKELVDVVESYQRREPHTRTAEIDRAFQLARSRLGGTSGSLVLALLALSMLIAGIAFFLTQSR